MISDEALVKYANRTKGISRNALEVVYLVIQEMAAELLTYREEKRKAEEERVASWKRLPKWVQWKATDMNGATFLYENKPKPCRGEWMQPTATTRIVKFVGPVLYWKDTIEERP